MEVHGWASVWLPWLALSSSLAGGGGGSAGAGGAGWLGRVVRYHKNHFIDELKQLAPINIQASIEAAPAGYVDSAAWDYASVSRLLALIGVSETARPVRVALRRALSGNETALPVRRFMSRQKSYKFFPSIAQMYMSNMYYDDVGPVSSEEAPQDAPPDSAVVRLSNPVEARLPSATISINLLKEILEARALAARKMPTTKTTSGWIWTTKRTPVLPSGPPATTNPESTTTPASAPSTATDPGTTVASAVTDPGTTGPPPTGPPATGPPATGPPATGPPATGPPATGPPATDPPATGPPAADPPAAINPPAT